MEVFALSALISIMIGKFVYFYKNSDKISKE